MIKLIQNGVFTIPTSDDIRAEIIEMTQSHFGVNIDLSPESFLGMFVNLRTEIAMRDTARLYEIWSNTTPLTAENTIADASALDRLLFPLLRLSATPAIGVVQFTVQSGDLPTVSTGSIISRQGLDYRIVSVVDIASGTYQIESVLAGVNQNTVEGSEFTGNYTDVTITAITSIGGGTDTETDVEFYDRWRGVVSRLSGSSIAGKLETSLQAVNGVSYARLYVNNTDSIVDNIPSRGYDTVIRFSRTDTLVRQEVAEVISRYIGSWIPERITTNEYEVIRPNSQVADKYYFTEATKLANFVIDFSIKTDSDYLTSYASTLIRRTIEYIGGVYNNDNNENEFFKGELSNEVGGKIYIERLRNLIFELHDSDRIQGVTEVVRVKVLVGGVIVMQLPTTEANTALVYQIDRDKYVDITNTDVAVSVVV